MVFRIDQDEIEIIDLDYEDYRGAPEGERKHPDEAARPPRRFVKHEIVEPLGLSVTHAV